MTTLLQTIGHEAAAVRRFIALLRQEQEALRLGNDETLLELVEQKTGIADELTRLATQRNATLGKAGLPPDRPGIEAWLTQKTAESPAHDSRIELAALWDELMTLVAEARDLNRLNGDLIQIRMRHNSQALAALLGASQPLGLYGADGLAMPSGTRRINDAA